LLALPGVSLHMASALLLFELKWPLLPVCVNAHEEARAVGWVPPFAGADAAFLHLDARVPRDCGIRRALYACLTRQNVFRLTRRNVIGVDVQSATEETRQTAALRNRRGQLSVKLLVRSAPPGTPLDCGKTAAAAPTETVSGVASGAGAATGMSGGEAAVVPAGDALLADSSDEEEGDEDEDEAVRALRARSADLHDLLVVGSHEAAVEDGMPLPDVIEEALQWHQLYPDAGCTPAIVTLRALDPVAASRVAAAFVDKRLPLQQQHPDDWMVKYVVEVSWSHAELLACATMLSAHDAPLAPTTPLAEHSGVAAGELASLSLTNDTAEGRAGSTAEGAGGSGWDAPAGGGPALFGFGAACESGAHLAAKCDRPEALESLWRAAEAQAGTGGRYPPLDTRGRSALHAAAQAGAINSLQRLLALGAEAFAVDHAGEGVLGLAAAAGQHRAVEALLDAAPGTLTQPNGDGSLPLELAAGGGDLACVDLMLERGAPIDAQSKLGRTALHAAARGGHLQICDRLVARGANLRLKDLTERHACDMLPPAVAGEGEWLVDMTREAMRKPKPPQHTAAASAATGGSQPTVCEKGAINVGLGEADW